MPSAVTKKLRYCLIVKWSSLLHFFTHFLVIVAIPLNYYFFISVFALNNFCSLELILYCFSLKVLVTRALSDKYIIPFNSLQTSGNHMYHMLYPSLDLHFAHRVYLCFSYYARNKQQFFFLKQH
jgi:hypothetical protein